MNFLNPAFLFGFFAISIPIVIHLFNFHRPKKVLFTNVKFLREVKETTNQKLRLKHLLILISRILFITFLVFTFAQPFLVNKNSSVINGAQSVSIYLDNSFSMENEVEKSKSLDVAIKSIQKLTETYPAGTQYYLLNNDFEGKDQFAKNKEKLNERLTEIKYSNLFKQADKILSRQSQSLLETPNSNNQIFWFTDFQKSTIGDLEKINFDTASKVFLIPIQNKENSNIYIDSIWLSNPMVKMNENNTLELLLKNDGNRKIKDLVLKLYINDVQVSTSAVSIEPNSKVNTQFIFNVNAEGQKRCKITFDDYPISFDNTYYFVLSASPKIRILHLYEKESKAITNVYSNDNVFALESHSINDFDNSLISVSNLILLDGLREIPASIEGSLKEFVKNGGSLFLYPSEHPNIDSYNAFLGTLSVPKIHKTAYNPASSDSSYQKKSGNMIQEPDLNNPFYKGLFEKNERNMEMPFAFPVVSWNVKGDLLLKLKNDEPFLSLFPSGKGKVYLAAAPLQVEYTNLLNHSIFVLLMYKAGFNSLLESERLAYSFQDPTITMDIENYNSDKMYQLTSGKYSIIPGQRISGRKLILEIPRDELQPGFYDLSIDGKPVKTIAFNYGKEESIQQFYDSKSLSNTFQDSKNVKIYEAGNSDEFINKFKKDNIGIPLWKYCLILCLIFLAIEILLIRFL